MNKNDDKLKDNFQDKTGPFRAVNDEILKEEKQVLALISQNKAESEYKRLGLVESMLTMVSNYIVMNNISQSVLLMKNDEALNDARKAIYKSIIYLEEIVTGSIDAPFADYEEKLLRIESFNPDQRYLLARKMGLAIQLLENAYGDNSKWKWSFVEIEGRFAAVTKNLINLRNVMLDSEPGAEFYESTVFHLRLVRKLLMQAADRYREMYELSTKRIDDFKKGILFLSSLKRLNILTGADYDAASVKKKLDIWNNKLNIDMAKQEKSKGKS